MKKLLSISVASLALAAMAAYTPTTVGVTKITTTNKSTIVPVAYKSLSTGESIAVADLVKAANLPSQTMLYVYNGSKYFAYQNGNGTWTGVATASTIDGINTPDQGTDSLTLAAGSAVWIVLASAPNPSQDIYVYGAYQTGVTSAAAGSGVSTLVANPLQSNAVVSSISGLTKGDIILVPKGDTANPDRYVCSDATSPTWLKGRSASGLPTFAVGQGFWYVSATNSVGATITWGSHE